MAVRKRGNRWYYDFQVRGIRYRGSILEARNKAQAERAEAQIKLAVFERKFGDGPVSRNFAEFVTEEYEPWAKTKRSYRTSDYFHIPRLAAYFKKHSLADISPMAVERYKRERLATPAKGSGKPRKPATVNRELACLSRILTMAVDNGLISVNPCSRVKRLREDNTRTRYLSEAEEEQLMDAITKPFERLRPLIILALNTGMRQGEILNLAWPQIDWERNLITVTSTKNNQDRTIPMNETVKALLINLWRESDKAGGNLFKEDGHAVSVTFSRLARRAKIMNFRFHDLRHTFATRLAPFTDAFTLAALLGHKTLAMTARYTHPTDDSKRRAITALNGLAQKSGHKMVTIDISTRTSKAS